MPQLREAPTQRRSRQAGGDGSNGTVEYPTQRLDPSNDDKAPHWWAKLTEVEQRAISLAYQEE